MIYVIEDCSNRGESSSGAETSHEEDTGEPPAIVVYLVEPFTLGSDSSDLQRLACLGLLRCFNTVLAALPEPVRANITLQVLCLKQAKYKYLVQLSPRLCERKGSEHRVEAVGKALFCSSLCFKLTDRVTA